LIEISQLKPFDLEDSIVKKDNSDYEFKTKMNKTIDVFSTTDFF
jgi:hypothetical protein